MKNFLIGRALELGSYPPPVVDLTDGSITIRDYASFLLKVNATPADATIQFSVGGNDVAVSNNGSLECYFKQGEVVDIEASHEGYNTKTMQVVMDKPKTINVEILPEGVYRPEEAPNGVYIYGDNGLMYESDIYNRNNAAPNGVGVKTSECSFVVGIHSGSKSVTLTWGANNVDVSIFGAFSSNTNTAFTYKNGREVNDIIHDANLNAYAINYCCEISYHSNNGYLASVYEMQVINDNIEAISNCIGKINSVYGSERMDEIEGRYWSSIQATEQRAWACYFANGKMSKIAESKDSHLQVMVLTEFA